MPPGSRKRGRQSQRGKGSGGNGDEDDEGFGGDAYHPGDQVDFDDNGEREVDDEGSVGGGSTTQRFKGGRDWGATDEWKFIFLVMPKHKNVYHAWKECYKDRPDLPLSASRISLQTLYDWWSSYRQHGMLRDGSPT